MSRLKTLRPRIEPAQTSRLKSAAPTEWGSGRGGRPWRRIRERILIRDQYTCQKCGKITEQLEVDHIIGKTLGGTDDDLNLQSLCVPCHQVKTAAESRGINE
ncbi:hypothetical protein PSCICO_47560 [Pseudomonas cichorii]|uniref:HNH endonuclease n=1 Tax=Pseudomonas cichorii TaxID=36746 RepID=UPI001911177F|nr:hypothetical protein PSCICO_47560 [Pseudomonas cichorii]